MKSTALSADGKKLVTRLKNDHEIELPDDVVIRRTYAGWRQKAHGAWSWFFYSPTDGALNFGSSETVRNLVTCKKFFCYKSGSDTEFIIESGDYKPTPAQGE